MRTEWSARLRRPVQLVVLFSAGFLGTWILRGGAPVGEPTALRFAAAPSLSIEPFQATLEPEPVLLWDELPVQSGDDLVTDADPGIDAEADALQALVEQEQLDPP